MKEVIYNPQGVCCKELHIRLTDENIIDEVKFIGGCPGNTLGISSLVKGMKAIDVADRLKNITCGNRSTSCPAQLSEAIIKIVSK